MFWNFIRDVILINLHKVMNFFNNFVKISFSKKGNLFIYYLSFGQTLYNCKTTIVDFKFSRWKWIISLTLLYKYDFKISRYFSIFSTLWKIHNNFKKCIRTKVKTKENKRFAHERYIITIFLYKCISLSRISLKSFYDFYFPRNTSVVEFPNFFYPRHVALVLQTIHL